MTGVQTCALPIWETLWDIASELASDEQDVREVVYDLQKLNGIAPDADLKVGQKIVIAK